MSTKFATFPIALPQQGPHSKGLIGPLALLVALRWRAPDSLDNRQSLLGKLQAHGGEAIVQGSAR
ncbi:hypothetical protein LEMLEM_LOCUS23540, partial [Lemmus lemmus]